MQRSQTTPWWEPPGGLNVHRTFRCSRNSPILCWFQPSIASRNSLSLRTKFPPLSDLTSSGCPLQAMKRRMALIKESASRLWATSKCMALTDKHIFSQGFFLFAQRTGQNSRPLQKWKAVSQVSRGLWANLPFAAPLMALASFCSRSSCVARSSQQFLL